MTIYRTKDLAGRNAFNQDFPNLFYTAGTEDDFDPIDMFLTAITNPNRIYSVEVKIVGREYAKFIWRGKDYGFQIDAKKIDALWDKWLTEGRIPILYIKFNDYTIVWDIRDIDYKSRERIVETNDDGQHYGRSKSPSMQTYLFKDEAAWIKNNK